jgi:GNAT superfamily N-acetyltransferase
MKVVKIKRLPNKKDVLEMLIRLVEGDDCNNGNWPLAQPINLPTEDFYVVVEDGKIIPAYIHVKNDEALVLWVAKPYRKLGYARFLINSLQVKYAVAHEPSVKFWKSVGFKRISHGNGPVQMKR